MDKNTVLLSLEEYNRLRDFKLNVEKGNVVHINNVNPFHGAYYAETFII